MSNSTDSRQLKVAEAIPTQVMRHLGLTSDAARSMVPKPTGYLFNGTRMISMADLRDALESGYCERTEEKAFTKLKDWNISMAPNVAPYPPTSIVRKPGQNLDAKGRLAIEQDEMMHGQVEMLGSVVQLVEPNNHLYIKNGLVSMECGTGKTRAAATIAYYSPIDRGWPVVYITYSNESFLQICSDFYMCNIVNIAKIESNGVCSLYDANTGGWTELHNLDQRPQMLLMTYTVANILRHRYMNDTNGANKATGDGKRCNPTNRNSTPLSDIACALMCLLRNGPNGLMILDEVHRCAASEWRQILKHANAKVRVGMTATLLREDLGIDMLQKVVGPTLLDYTRANVPINYELVTVPPDNWRACNRFKIWQLFMRLQKLPSPSRSMVFCDSTEQLLQYYIHLKALLTREDTCQWDVIGPIDHTSDSNTRDLAISKMTELNVPNSIVLFCCRIFDESVNLQSREQQDHIIYLFQINLASASRRQEEQRLGRARRGNCCETHMCTLVEADKHEHTFANQRIESLKNKFIVHQTTTGVDEDSLPQAIKEQLGTCSKAKVMQEGGQSFGISLSTALDSKEDDDAELQQDAHITDSLKQAIYSHGTGNNDNKITQMGEENSLELNEGTMQPSTVNHINSDSEHLDDDEDDANNPLRCFQAVSNAHQLTKRQRKLAR